MEEPTPEQFGLVTSQVEELRRDDANADSKRSQFASRSFILIIVAVVIYYLNTADRTASALLGGVVVLFICVGIGEVLFPANAQLKAYDSARAEFKAWLIGQRRAWWMSLDGSAFEHEMGRLFAKMGYKVVVTGASGDGGCDLIVSKDGQQIVVQCKAHHRPVGPAVVRELFGVLSADNKFSKAILVALSGVTRGAKRFIGGKPIEILTVKDVLRLAQECAYTADARHVTRIAPSGGVSVRHPIRTSAEPAIRSKSSRAATRPEESDTSRQGGLQPKTQTLVGSAGKAVVPSTASPRSSKPPGVLWKEVSSSAIRAIGYDQQAQTLFVEFRSGGVYEYHQVPVAVALEFMMTDSHGQFLQQRIIKRYAERRI